jgi:methylthioribose-1-phosphate isomerase|tara:strand:+ start:1282 stop:1767 length:486 start_codon:yes stop_codon:yes gene_type:complete
MIDFFNHRTIKWKNNKVIMIDQTKLPEETVYFEASNYRDVAHAIKTMIIRGAPAIGIAAAMGLGLSAFNSNAKNKNELVKDLQKARAVLKSTRPTAINLFWALDQIMDKVETSNDTISNIKKFIVKESQKMADEDIVTNKIMGKIGQEILSNKDTVLTHCR